MTNQEFSDEFDVLYNNITSNQAPGLDEYEKSVFLTKAQDEILKSYFSPRLNKSQEGFDGSERRQIDFSMVLATAGLVEGTEDVARIDPRSVVYVLPQDALMILNERIKAMYTDGTEKIFVIVPIRYDEYNRLMSKPYKRPLKNQAWRLISNGHDAEIIFSHSNISEAEIFYTCRYIKRPQAIILTDLEDVTLDGKTNAQSCELDPILHPEILQRAVELAKAAWQGGLDSQIALGANSETNMGVVPQSR